MDLLLLADNDPGTVPAHWITAADAVGVVSEDGSTIEGTLDDSRIRDGETWGDLGLYCGRGPVDYELYVDLR